MSKKPVPRIPTLRGLMSVPPVVPGRNFLKENKASLRNLEKKTIEKRAAQEPMRPKWMPGLCRSVTKASLDAPTTEERIKSTTYRIANKPEQRTAATQIYDSELKHCASSETNCSTTSIGLQTDDILDETFLLNALKKCNSETIETADDDFASQDPQDDDACHVLDYDMPKQEEELISPRNSESDSNDNYELPDDALLDDVSLSAQSCVTAATNASKQSKRSPYVLGTRDNLRLPRYLAKAKRDKAAAIARLPTPDPDCPPGQVRLSEHERLFELRNAHQKHKSLMKEISSMSLTNQTLRIRNRKDEIEKELEKLENLIRLYSKPKVYVPAP